MIADAGREGKMENKALEIVIPVLNEEQTLDKNVKKVMDFLNATELKELYLITIADNGSTDNTAEIAKKLCSQFPELVKFIQVPEKGVGLAFRTAIQQSSSDFIGYMDLDLATDISHLVEVYDCLKTNKANIVVGSRLLPSSKVIGRSPIREVTSRALNFIMKNYLGARFTDAMCGFKFYEKKIADQVVSKASDSNGWFYCAEMMFIAEQIGIPVCEIPIKWTDDPNSKVNITKLSMDYLNEIKRLKQTVKKA